LDAVTKEVKFSRRGAFLGDNASFYSYEMVTKDLTDKIIGLYESLQGACKESLSVYGELFGGSFYGDQAEGCKRTQSAIEYSPKTEFAAFDVKVDGTYLAPINFLYLLEDADFYLVPTIKFTESLQEALDLSNTFESLVPAQLGYTPKEGNIAEGKVMRPFVSDLLAPSQSRIILKDRTESFSEKATKAKKTAIDLTREAEEDLNLICEYVTSNRLNCILSKEEELTQKDFGRIMGLLTQDALTDYLDDNDINLVDLKELHKVCWKTLIRQVNQESSVIVRQYWKQAF
jgi:Rnl2 family RNA ligase